jgi:hypothetical protein
LNLGVGYFPNFLPNGIYDRGGTDYAVTTPTVMSILTINGRSVPLDGLYFGSAESDSPGGLYADAISSNGEQTDIFRHRDG